MPEGTEATAPKPLPLLATLSVRRGKGAVTVIEEPACTTQVPVPAQAPLQPEKTEFASGVGVSVTWRPFSKEAVQDTPQLMPAGAEATAPVPVPFFRTWRVHSPAGPLEGA